MAAAFTISTSATMAYASREWRMRAMARTCMAMTADCALNIMMQVEIRLAAAISSTVLLSNTVVDDTALAASVSYNPISHLISAVKTTARIARAEATPRKSGTKYMRNFATLLSTSANASAIPPNFTSQRTSAIATAGKEKVAAMPQGRNSPTSSAMMTVSLMAPAHSIKARLGPEYSSTMAS